MELPALRGWRLRRALSQAELSERSGVGTANVSRIESGKQLARPSTARRLAEALAVEPADLMGPADREAAAMHRARGGE